MPIRLVFAGLRLGARWGFPGVGQKTPWFGEMTRARELDESRMAFGAASRVGFGMVLATGNWSIPAGIRWSSSTRFLLCRDAEKGWCCMSISESNTNMNVIDRDGLDRLFEVLVSEGYLLIGPRVRDASVVYDEISSTRDMPVGLKDEQEPGRYRLHERGDGAVFGYVVGPHSWKRELFPPVQKLYQVQRNGGKPDMEAPAADVQKRALIGVRGCELAAMAIQDKVFVDGPFVDEQYKRRRENLFIVAVHCNEPAATCFCGSMGTGPAARSGFDLAMTEVIGGGIHEFIVETGTELGATMLDAVPHRESTEDDRVRRAMINETARQGMTRAMRTDDVHRLLTRNYESPRWEEVSERCLSCANCTMVCPTCFCSTVEDVTDLSGDHAERWRKWDSCFTSDFSYLVGGSVRPSISSQYRQWLTHKLATWQDQFGVIGCVGCGRCISWCPVGIDLTEEVAAIRESEHPAKRYV